MQFFFHSESNKDAHSVSQRLRMKKWGNFCNAFCDSDRNLSTQTFMKASYNEADRFFCRNVRQEKTSKKAADLESSCGRSKPFAPIPYATNTTEI